MGGRRPSRIRDIAGSSKSVTKFSKDLNKAIEEKNVDRTLNTAFKIASEEKAIENFAYGLSLLGPLQKKLIEIEEKKLSLNRDDREKIAIEELSKIEKEKNLSIPTGIRNLIIRSATKSLKGEKEWKKCGKKMNLPKSSYADICYDCTYPKDDEKTKMKRIEKSWKGIEKGDKFYNFYLEINPIEDFGRLYEKYGLAGIKIIVRTSVNYCLKEGAKSYWSRTHGASRTEHNCKDEKEAIAYVQKWMKKWGLK